MAMPPPPPSGNVTWGSAQYGECPKTWLVESILVTWLCLMPFGIPAIVYASRVKSHFNVGDIAGAQNASAKAKKWTLISIGLAAAELVAFAILVYAMLRSNAI